MIDSLQGAKQKHDVRRIKRLVFSFKPPKNGNIIIDGTIEFDDEIAELSHIVPEKLIEYYADSATNIPNEISKMTRKLILFMKNPESGDKPNE
jgi:hypothetical protein